MISGVNVPRVFVSPSWLCPETFGFDFAVFDEDKFVDLVAEFGVWVVFEEFFASLVARAWGRFVQASWTDGQQKQNYSINLPFGAFDELTVTFYGQ